MSRDTWTHRYNLSETITVEVYQDACGGFLVTLKEQGNRIRLSAKEFKNLRQIVAEVKV